MSIGLRIALIFMLGVALVTGYRAWEYHVYREGWDARDQVAKVREGEIKAEADRKVSDSVDTARKREQQLLDDNAEKDLKRYKENQRAETTIAGLRADARALRLKLSINVTRGSVCGASQAANPAAAGGSGDEARADVVPEVADAVLGIAGDIAKGVRERNELIDRYNAARAICNAGGVQQ